MRNVAPIVAPQAASPAHSDTSKNASKPYRSAYSTPNSAAEQITYLSIENPMSGADAKAEDGGGNVGGSPGLGNVRRPILSLPAKPHASPLSGSPNLSPRSPTDPRSAPMGGLFGVCAPFRRTGRKP